MNDMKTQNTTMLFVAIGTLAASICILAYIGWFISAQGGALQSDLQQYTDQEAQQQEYLMLERELAATAEDRATLAELALDGDEDTVAFLSAVDGLAARLGVSLVTEKLEVQVQKDAPFDSLDATFGLSGSEAAVFRMIRLLESWPYHSYLTALEIDRIADALPGEPAMTARATLSVTLIKDL